MTEEEIGKISGCTISIDKQYKYLSIENNAPTYEEHSHIIIDFKDVDKFIEIFQKIKKKMS